MKLAESKFTIKDVTFQVNKLGAMDAWDIMERCREAIAGQEVSSTGDSEVAQAMGMFKSLMKLDTSFVKWLRGEMFKCVEFQVKSPDGRPNSYMNLASVPDMAFQNLEPIHVYEVIGRAFAVNFTASLEELTSRFPHLKKLAGNMSKRSTSTQSSQPQSQKDSLTIEDLPSFP